MSMIPCPTGLAEVRLRLEATLASLPDPGETPEEQYDRIEEICIAVLDSEYSQYEADVLEQYLLVYLQLRRMELGVINCPHEA